MKKHKEAFTKMKIYFEDYRKENKPFLEKILSNVVKVIELKSEYEHEKYIQEFEQEFAKYNNSKYAVGVNSGTTALELALRASGIKEGDEVIIPSYTYIATALAVSNLGVVPIFVDVKEDTFTIDPAKIERNITKRTKAIIPVHIHGNPCDMEEIIEITKKYNLTVIEDASHAHGAEYKGKKVGNFGIGCFSSHTSKNLSGIGNSGLITVNDIKTYQSIRKMIEVTNDPDLKLCKRTPCKINVLQAAVLKTKLTYLDKLNCKRRSNASIYIQNLPKTIKFQREEKNSKHVYRDFVILIKKREEFMCYLEKNQIEAKVRYKIPLHLTKYYENLAYKKGDLTITEKIFNEVLWMPISYAISGKEIRQICNLVKNWKLYE